MTELNPAESNPTANGPAASNPTASRPAGPRRTRLSADERRASILAAAVEVFAEHGYQRGKVSEVAARIGVTEPVVFQNFKSKAGLFTAVVAHAADRVCAELDEAAAGVPVVALLTELTSPAHLDRLHARGAIGVLFADSVAATADPAVAEAGRAAVRRIAEGLAALLRRGQATGELRADTDPDAAAWLLISLVSARPLRLAALPELSRDHIERELAAMTAQLIAPPGD
ncbi:TetR/AcrR family transcriptional regulator [Kitasatospora sp. NPDC097643]|uniref:TetR/AcrR family transcriptional regulator n=1 Tax=Kitasatospora sp. NPDC097643 TaxID=3157230 RepID=UPI00331A395F